MASRQQSAVTRLFLYYMMMAIACEINVTASTRFLPVGDKGSLNPSLSSEPYDVVAHCPQTCTCHLTTTPLKMVFVIEKCEEDPGPGLETITQAYPEITTLKIIASNLSKLPEVVCDLKELTILDLSKNHLTNIPWRCLKQLNKLESISVAYNKFTKLSDGVVYGFRQLNYLNMSHNRIDDIGYDVFTRVNHLSLKILDLSSNHLVSLDIWPLLLFDQGNKINLSNNNISQFTNHQYLKFKCGAGKIIIRGSINLKRNNVKRLIDIFNGWGIHSEADRVCILRETSRISIKHNPFICDCLDYPIYKLLPAATELFRDGIICAKPRKFYRLHLNQIPLDQITCEVKQECPAGCVCLHIPDQLNISIDCRGANHTEMPSHIPPLPTENYTYNLNFVGNRIDTLEDRSYLYHTTEAIFSRNRIQILYVEALEALDNATMIYLDHNELYGLPTDISNVNLTGLEDMRLHGNKWICDCHSKDTRAWLIRQGNRISDQREILCNSPYWVKGRNMLLLNEDEFVCKAPDVGILWYVGIGATTFCSWLVLIILIMTILYTSRLRLYRRFNWHPFEQDECVGEYKEFDIFIAYAEVNQEFAIGELCEELERWGYKVAQHHVNFIAGKPIRVNIEECVRKSKRTITVLSPEFFLSDWCVCEFLTAFNIDKKQGTQRQIGVLLKDLDEVEDLDPRAKKFVKGKYCLRVGCEFFWEKLTYHLAIKKMGEPGNNTADAGPNGGRRYEPPNPHVTTDEEHLLE